MNGLSMLSGASNTTQIFVSVHTGDLVAGLIGGAIVLVGVLLTELLVRHRERRRRLEAAAWELQRASGGLLMGSVGEITPAELQARLSALLGQLGRIRGDARWPIRNAKAIQAEIDAVAVRLVVAVGKEVAGHAGPPRLRPILGDKLFRLVLGPSKATITRKTLDDAMRDAGLPSVEDVTADDSPNEPLAEKAG